MSLTASWVCDLGEEKLVGLVVLGRSERREEDAIGSGSFWLHI